MRVRGRPPYFNQGRGAEGIEFGGDKHPCPIGEDGFGAARQGNDMTSECGGIPGFDVVSKGLFEVEFLGQARCSNHHVHWRRRQQRRQIQLDQSTLFDTVDDGSFHVPKLRHGKGWRKDGIRQFSCPRLQMRHVFRMATALDNGVRIVTTLLVELGLRAMFDVSVEHSEAATLAAYPCSMATRLQRCPCHPEHNRPRW